MVDYGTFSALRLGRLFTADVLASYPYFVAVEADFDTGYLGGQWHEELIDGVQFFYPSQAGDQLGVIELRAARCVMAAAVRDRPSLPPPLFIPGWTGNANRVLEALELPIRMGSDDAAVRSLAAGRVRSFAYPDEWYGRCSDVARGTLSSLSFACRCPHVYHLNAVVHATEGLVKFDVRRPDLIRANESEKGGYDNCFGWLFDDAT